MPGPIVSVVVTCYNQAPLIAGAVESVLAQTRREAICQVVVVDDGSSDGSADVIAGLVRKHSVITPVFQPNGGASAARNAGIDVALGAYVAFLDGDDTWLPTKLETQLPTIEAHRDVGLFYSDFVEVDEAAVPARRVVHRARRFRHDDGDVLRTLFLRGGSIVPSTAVVRREVFKHCGAFDTNLRQNEDPDMWLRIASCYPLHHISGVVAEKRNLAASLGDDIQANAEAQRYTTRKMVAVRPELRTYARRRDAAIDMRAGYKHLMRAERKMAATALRRAVVKNPMNMQAALYLCLSAMPVEPRWAIMTMKRMLPSRLKV